MPKKAKLGSRSSVRIRGGNRLCEKYESDDENDGISSGSLEHASVASVISDGSYLNRQEDAGFCSEDTSALNSEGSIDLFEEKIMEHMDLATQKSAQGRQNALQNIYQALLKRYVPDFVDRIHMTLTDLIERSLKKGKTGERVAAANLVCLFCVQLGSSLSVDESYAILKPILMSQVADVSIPSESRCAVVRALGICCFLIRPENSDDPEIQMRTVMSSLRGLYISASKIVCPDLQVAALSSWTLLATLVSNSEALDLLKSELSLLENLLDSVDVELRIVSGEALAVLYESASEIDDGDEAYEIIEPLLPKIQQLATDSLKYRSKKDKKEQKCSFRDILRTLEVGDLYYEKIVVNEREVLEIDSWQRKRHYDAIRKVLGSGTNAHLTGNILIRSVFEMGPPMPLVSNSSNDCVKNKSTKSERHLANVHASKIRTKLRGKYRDKRCSVIV